MKTNISIFAVVVFSLAVFAVAMVSGGAVDAFVGEPVAGVQVVVQQETGDKNNPGYRGARPTDDKGSAPFASMDEGTYTVTLKRFTKATAAYRVAVQASGGIKKTEVWDAEKKDSFKTTVVLKGTDMQSLTVIVTVADAPAAQE